MNFPKYLNCKRCEIAIPVLKNDLPYLNSVFMLGSVDIMCIKCGKDFEDLLLCDHRI